MPNGNTLVCSGEKGRFVEVRPNGETVWEYWNPFGSDDPPGGERSEGRRPPNRQGGPPPGSTGRRRGGPARTGVFRALRYSPDYAGLQALRKTVD